MRAALNAKGRASGPSLQDRGIIIMWGLRATTRRPDALETHEWGNRQATR